MSDEPEAEGAGRELVPCQNCAGNGEIVTDWDRYLKPWPGDAGDEAVADCPMCDGKGRVSPRSYSCTSGRENCACYACHGG